MPVKNREMTANSQQFRIGDLRVDIDRQAVTRDRKSIELPGLSFRLLVVLADRWPAAVSRRELAREVWGDVVVSDDALRQRIRLLRQSLGDANYISAIKGIGYRLTGPVSTVASGGQRRKFIVAAAIVAASLVAFVMFSDVETYDLVHEVRHLSRH